MTIQYIIISILVNLLSWVEVDSRCEVNSASGVTPSLFSVQVCPSLCWLTYTHHMGTMDWFIITKHKAAAKHRGPLWPSLDPPTGWVSSPAVAPLCRPAPPLPSPAAGLGSGCPPWRPTPAAGPPPDGTLEGREEKNPGTIWAQLMSG